jgi:hypothetical protein
MDGRPPAVEPLSTGSGEEQTWWEATIGTRLDAYSYRRLDTYGTLWLVGDDRDFTVRLTPAECRRVAELLGTLADRIEADHVEAMTP